MAVLLGTRGGDILEWRGVAELVAELRAMAADMMSSKLADESLDFLKAFKERLEEETDFEERFAEEFGAALEELEQATHEDEVFALLPRFKQMAQDYFMARGSVVAVHALCNAYRDGLVRWTLRRVEDVLEVEEMRRPPAPYCWLASGSAGRMEQTFCVDPGYVLIHGAAGEEDSAYFDKFAYRAVALLGALGLLPATNGATMLKAVWRGGRKAWREEIAEKLQSGDRKWLETLVGRADLRFMYGNGALGEEMIHAVRSQLEFRPGKIYGATILPDSASRTRAALYSPAPALREMGKSIAETSPGLDFFGRLKVEKSGRQRGRFNLEQYALTPLIANIRMLAIDTGLSETGTIARIKGLQGAGRLSVELAERLLVAYHEFTRLKLLLQIRTGCGNEPLGYLDPQDLSEDEDLRLRSALETVADLEKIVYLCFTEQG